jgi:hypothetical protein
MQKIKIPRPHSQATAYNHPKVFTFTLLLSDGQMGESWEPSNKTMLLTDKIYYSIEKTDPSSYRRGGPLPNCVGVKYENKNMVTGPDGALHQE